MVPVGRRHAKSGRVPSVDRDVPQPIVMPVRNVFGSQHDLENPYPMAADILLHLHSLLPAASLTLSAHSDRGKRGIPSAKVFYTPGMFLTA